MNKVNPPKRWRHWHNELKLNMQGTDSLLSWAVANSKKDPAMAAQTVAKQNKAMDRKFVKENGAHGVSCF